MAAKEGVAEGGRKRCFLMGRNCFFYCIGLACHSFSVPGVIERRQGLTCHFIAGAHGQTTFGSQRTNADNRDVEHADYTQKRPRPRLNLRPPCSADHCSTVSPFYWINHLQVLQ